VSNKSFDLHPYRKSPIMKKLVYCFLLLLFVGASCKKSAVSQRKVYLTAHPWKLYKSYENGVPTGPDSCTADDKMHFMQDGNFVLDATNLFCYDPYAPFTMTERWELSDDEQYLTFITGAFHSAVTYQIESLTSDTLTFGAVRMPDSMFISYVLVKP
jgi:hypothetical protein